MARSLEIDENIQRGGGDTDDSQSENGDKVSTPAETLTGGDPFLAHVNKDPIPLVINRLSSEGRTQRERAPYDPNQYEDIEVRMAHPHVDTTTKSIPADLMVKFTPPLVTPPPPSVHVTPVRGETSDKLQRTSPVKDVVWLLHTLRCDGSSTKEEKKLAIAELKRLAKSGTDDYWKRNAGQVDILLFLFSLFISQTMHCLSLASECSIRGIESHMCDESRTTDHT